VGYGLTDRLLSLGKGDAVKLDQSFDVKPFPGTSLESLRLRFGADRKELPANLELIEQESRKKETSKLETSKPRQVQPASEAAPAGEPAPPVAPLPPLSPDLQP
jgi:hypothetical protein